jgi:hypothetical protein
MQELIKIKHVNFKININFSIKLIKIKHINKSKEVDNSIRLKELQVVNGALREGDKGL